jgi:hypothetical protein
MLGGCRGGERASKAESMESNLFILKIFELEFGQEEIIWLLQELRGQAQ